jgi:gamma-glutamyltranspeptidase
LDLGVTGDFEAYLIGWSGRTDPVCDPEHVPVDIARFLSDAWAEEARRRIRLDRAGPSAAWDGVEHKNTTYLCVSIATATRSR